MRNSWKLHSSFLILVLIFSSCSSIISTPVTSVEKNESVYGTSADLVPHGPITITDDADFEILGFNGSGMPGNPYVIEGFRIVSESDCISVSDTTKYFVIRNCEIYSTSDRQGQGVHLANVTHGTIENCTIWEKSYAIHFEKSPFCSAIGNRIFENSIGIRVYDGSDNCTIYGNHIFDHPGHLGIYLWYRSAYCHIENNILEGDYVSIQGWSSESWDHTFIDNLVNGKPIGYFNSISDVTINGEDYGQIILSHCTRVTVDGGRFSDSHAPVILGYCIDCTVKNLYVVNDASRGVYVEYGSGNLVTNNTVIDSDIGIFTDGGTDMEVINNLVTGCNEGIRVSSASSNVLNNTVGSSTTGIYIWRNDCVVSGNIVYSCGTGIDLHYSDFINCTWNKVLRSTANGIFVNGGESNFISFNLALGNENNGISIVEWVGNTGSNNTVFGNELGWNYAGNCYDSGSNNSWDDGSGTGNAYHDYVSGTYGIDGTAGSVDNYPIVLEDFNAPIIEPTPDDIIVVGSSGNSFQWNVSEDYPKSFTLQRNAITIDSGTWIGSSYIVELDGLVEATYTFTLSVEDYVNGIESDSVVITVQGRVTHAPVRITANSDFVTLGFPGGGTSSNPYVIENLDILTDENGIEISDVTAYFVIRNCYIISPTAEPDGAYGIIIHQSQNGRVENCEVTKKNFGIYFINTQSCSVSDSKLYYNNMGIHFDTASSCSIIGNSLYDNLYDRGIMFYSSNDNNLVRDNVMTDEGIILKVYSESSWIHTISGNTVNGKPVGYFLDRINLNLAGTPYAQVILARCSNVTVTGGDFNNVASGLEMGHCEGCSFLSNSITAAPGSNMDWTNAIFIVGSTGVSIKGVHIIGPYQEGITVQGSHDVIIQSNLIENAGTAITDISSVNSSIQSNYLLSCWRGITIGSDYSKVLSNIITNSASHGIEVRGSMYSVVGSNSISGCQRSGIELDASNHNFVIWNSIINCGEYGIALIDFSGQPFNNTLYGNFIGWNGDGNGYDEGLSNMWDDNVSQGNYWSDWGRVPLYYIPGSAGSVDRYSFATDYGPPSLSSPVDMTVESRISGQNIEWLVSDESPYRYETFRNGTLLQSDFWQTGIIQQPVWNNSIGIYNYTIVVEDLAGNQVVDMVIISVVDTIAPLVNQPSNLQFVVGTIGEYISWTPSDNNPHLYSLFLNGVSFADGLWNSSGETIILRLDGLAEGFYNYTIVFYDVAGNFVSSSVLVIVLEDHQTTTTTPTDTNVTPDNPYGTLSAVITVSSLVVIVIVSLLSLRIRRRAKWAEAMEAI